MKKLVLFCLLVFTIAVAHGSAAPKHRHNASSQVNITHKDSTSEEVTAYSDTTSWASDEAAAGMGEDHDILYDDEEAADDDFISRWTDSIGWGIGGLFLAFVIIVAVLLFLLSPFIVLLLILRYLIKRHNARVALAEKVIESGQPVPEELKSVDRQSDEYLWKRGIRNLSIGIGLMLMFCLLGSNFLTGIGILIACYGAGQAFLGRSARKNNHQEDTNIQA